MTPFAAAIVAWQAQFGRHDLPWQERRDPYRIWLAEVMLQQTQVATVRPYFLRFVERFPDLGALAAAPLDAVMEIWAGLGYYSRARNLHRCAQRVVADHGGAFPGTAAELAELPGIGRSTAAAIAVFSSAERVAILDGNVKRVMARHFAIEGYPGQAGVERALWKVAEREVPAQAIAAYTQGLMDLGATLCTRAQPACDRCPVADSCRALLTGRVTELPAPRPPRSRPLRSATLLLIRDIAGSFLLERRPPTGIWGGLASPLEFDCTLDDRALAAAGSRRTGFEVKLGARLDPLRHEFSHYSFVMRPRLAEASPTLGVSDAADLEWVTPATIEQAALPAPIRRLLRELAHAAADVS